MDHTTPAPSQLPTNSLDVIEHKHAVLSAVLALSDDAIISNSLQGIITSWNLAAEKMFGHSEADAVGQHISMIIPQDRIKEEEFITAELQHNRQVKHFETFRLAKKGTLVPISLSVSPVKDAGGSIIGAVKIARDLSDRQKADAKRGTLAAIVDSSEDTILSKTLEGVITSWNKAAEKMFGYTDQEAIGQHISLIIPNERLNEEQYIIGEVIKGNKVNHFQTIRVAKDGKQVPISVTVSPIMNDKGEIIGASKIARDITEQLLAQEENARLYEQVKMLNAKKDDFIGLASHELKTPLTSIKGYLDILDRLITDDRSHTFLRKVMHQVNRINLLISDLLDVSKIEAGKLQFSADPLDVYKLTADVIEMLSYNHKAYVIKLESDEQEAWIRGDAQRIEQVVINLLTNAIRYSPDANQIIVHLTFREDAVVIGVQDFGIGIPANKLTDVFSKYFRVDDHSTSISGLGIGLYLSHEVVSRHGGRIWVESELGKGSTFWFTLPR